MSSPSSSRENLTMGQKMPLWWARIPLLVFTIGFSVVGIAVGAQGVIRSRQLEQQIKDSATPFNVTVDFDMNNIRATSAVMTVLSAILAFVGIVCILFMFYDIVLHVISPKPSTPIKEKAMSDSDTASTRKLSLSTRTLRVQSFVLAFFTIALIADLIPSTIFARTGSGTVSIAGMNGGPVPGDFQINVDVVYWDYGFFRCLAAAPWFAIITSVPLTVLSYVAWRFAF